MFALVFLPLSVSALPPGCHLRELIHYSSESLQWPERNLSLFPE